MKNSIILGFIVALVLAMFTVCFFIHPVLILTLSDIMTLIVIDVVLAFFLALYLSDYFSANKEGKQNSLLIWTIVGVVLIFVPIVAAFIKYKKVNK